MTLWDFGLRSGSFLKIGKMLNFPRVLTLFCLISWTNGQCVDENGVFVDWVAMYKFPKDSKASNSYIDEGLAYAYISSKNPHADWKLSEFSIKDENSIPGRILSPIYKNDPDQFHMLYNDEHPNGTTSFTLGHTKGVVALNEKYGFWMIHSVPKYPPNLDSEKYDYPHTGQMYGQSFLCISLLTPTSAEQIGQQMIFNSPFIYSVNLPKWAEKNYPTLASAANGNHAKKGKSFNVMTFSSLGGHSFTSFAKAKHFGEDLYAELVAPTLKTNLMVESWPNGPGKMHSSCDNRYKVENIDSLDFEIQTKIKFSTHKDHAKWAVAYSDEMTMTDAEKYVCIGDINRMETQKKRGGGTVCFRNPDLWKRFTQIIQSVEACPRR